MEEKKKSRFSCFGRSSNKHGKTCSDLQLNCLFCQ
nr:PREDICTED: voltage-dependent L-type calcium channel subunit alpha-1D-like [Struthio camelus australis]